MDARPEKEKSNEFVDDLTWKDFFGSSVSLAPSLLSICVRQVNTNDGRCQSPKSGTQANAEDEEDDHLADFEQPAFNCEPSSENNVMTSSQSSALCSRQRESNYSDYKKRPLSLRSVSSNSSLSLQQHQHKKVARDAFPPKTGAPLSPIFCDLCKLPILCESHPVGNGGCCNRGSISTLCQSKYAETGWNNSTFLDQQNPNCLSIMECDGNLYMDVDADNAWSPDIEREVSVKLQPLLCHEDSISHTDHVVLEIVETERAYVRDLRDIIQGYIDHICASPGLMSKSDTDTMFGNIEDVFRFHGTLLQELEKSGTDPARIAECFVQSNSWFAIYSDYCTNYPRSVGILTRCMKDRQLADILKRQQMSLQHVLPLGSYLLKPVQRILKYHLLLQNLLNNFDENKAGYETISKAFKSMMSVANQINEMKRAHELSARIHEIQSLLFDWNRVDPIVYGDLVLEDQFQMFGTKAFRLVWVFRKAVVIAKKKEDETIQIKASIMFSNLMLVETIQRAPLNFHLIPFDNPKVQFTVQARTIDQKRRWCQELKKLILENYEAVIPEKARQLVMMLGKEEEPYVSAETKVEALGTVVPDLDLDQKPHTLHTSFSLQSIRSPLSTMPLQMSYSEGDYCNTLHTLKLLTAESLEKELTESDSHFNSSLSLGIKSHDCSHCAISKDSVSNLQTPSISEEPLPGDHTHEGLLMPNHLSCGCCDGDLANPSNRTLLSCLFKQNLANFISEKSHGTISHNKRELPNDYTLPDCLSNQGQLLLNLKSADKSLFAKDCSCSSDIRNSGIQDSIGNVFVDKPAFPASESACCVKSNRVPDKCFTRLSTPPCDFGSFVQDVQLSTKFGKTVAYYGTPIRAVEFPHDICGILEKNYSGMTSDSVQSIFKQETPHSQVLKYRQSECQNIDGSFDLFKANPRRSTSVQENMINSCVYIPSENLMKPKPKRSGSFHGNILYSSINHAHADHTALNSSNNIVTEPGARVSYIKNTLFNWTDKLSTRRSRNSENRDEPISFMNVTELSGEKTKLKDKVFLFARASYRKLKRGKALEAVDSYGCISSDPVISIPEVPSVTDNEPCARTQSVKLKGANFLSSYALTILPRQKSVKTKDSGKEELQNDKPDSAILEKFTNKPFVRRPKNCHTAEHQQTAKTEEQRSHDSMAYELPYADDENTLGSSVSIKKKETKSTENLDTSQDTVSIKTKVCSAISLPGIRNEFVWSSSSFSNSQKEAYMQTSVNTDTCLSCFTAPRGYWIPYIDDSDDE